MAQSRKFHWVEVNRDRTPGLPKRFNVVPYPSLLTLGDKDENVHRFVGFKKPEPFLAELREALHRYDLYKAGKDWDTVPPRPERICDEAEATSIPAPSEAGPSGITALDGSFFVAQGGKLFRVDPRDGKVQAEFQLAAMVRDLCTDGKKLYGVEYGWSAGKPIHVIDPSTGEAVSEIVTEANLKNKAYSAAGIAFRNGRLQVLTVPGEIHEVDPATGEVKRVLKTEVRYASGLDFDGRHFVVGTKDALCFLDPETGALARKVPVHYPLRAVAFAEGRYLLMEQPVPGFGRNHENIRLWPKKMRIHSLLLRAPENAPASRPAKGNGP